MSTVERLNQAVVVTGMSAHGVQVAELSVRFGEVVALAGPNGSGKSTISRAIVGELVVAGSIHVLGMNPTEDASELKGRIGFLVKDLETMGSLTSRDVLDICAAVRGCSTAYAKDLAERLDLDLDRPMGDLCRGQLRRLGIIQALMHKPDVIVLDDPMTELDDTARQALPALLHEAAARGAAVLLTAQSPSDAEAYADRLVFLDSSPVPESAPAVEDAEPSPAISCDAAAAGDWPQQIPTGYDPLRESELVPISVRRMAPAMSTRGRTPGRSSSSQGTGSADSAEPMGRVPP